MSKYSKQEIADATESLRGMLSPGDTVYTIVRKVAPSGMSRQIDLYIIRDNRPVWITGRVAQALEMTRADGGYGPIRVHGCGMDMCFAVVYDLGRVLFPDGFGVPGKMPMGHEIRPTTHENAAKAIELGATFHGRNGDTSGWDKDGGYALRKEAL